MFLEQANQNIIWVKRDVFPLKTSTQAKPRTRFYALMSKLKPNKWVLSHTPTNKAKKESQKHLRSCSLQRCELRSGYNNPLLSRILEVIVVITTSQDC